MTAQLLARVEASATRRIFGIGVLSLLAAALLWLGLSPQPADLWVRLGMLALGLGVGWAAWTMYRATSLALELRADGLHDSGGHLIAAFDQIEVVDRGTFAFKPSNGFLLRLSRKGPRRFLPGLYWQFGRRVGVGGVLQGAQTKQMADLIAVRLAEREGAGL